jgi:hypothetical protein
LIDKIYEDIDLSNEVWKKITKKLQKKLIMFKQLFKM